LPNIIKIDPYNFELYRFKVGSFLRHSVVVCSAVSIIHRNGTSETCRTWINNCPSITCVWGQTDLGTNRQDRCI